MDLFEILYYISVLAALVTLSFKACNIDSVILLEIRTKSLFYLFVYWASDVVEIVRKKSFYSG